MVRAKFTVIEVRRHYYSKTAAGPVTLVLSPMYDTSIPEDQRFSKANPSGRIEMTVDNPSAVEYLKPGGEFYVDFTATEQN